ncbi:structure-specific endonuclease subunit slx1 [Anaeramoeba flamelloides]|uniref:Structure-specific endonuclease subunit SLX1 homolog n=1 Tax=Anaeramoeba flamelloides TaxID=1746091 RepID=A0ABQ8YYF9_9EUKA|nr:structure-specific endonuclease subunit slx1 [Anaeramoeba flamelloides]
MSNFYSCYLLTSLNEKFKNHIYIGYTVNPVRRFRQHNGLIKGGAKKTSVKKPWDLVCVVFGFPNSTLALRFEWCWQNPYFSKQLKKLQAEGMKGFGNLHLLSAKIRVLHEILNTTPWKRLPLTVTFMTTKYGDTILKCPAPPTHIERVFTTRQEFFEKFKKDYLPIQKYLAKNSKQQTKENKEKTSFGDQIEYSPNENWRNEKCFVCSKNFDFHLQKKIFVLTCEHCQVMVHMKCLSTLFLKGSPNKLLPTKGRCPRCGWEMLWGQLIRNYKMELIKNTLKRNHPLGKESNFNLKPKKKKKKSNLNRVSRQLNFSLSQVNYSSNSLGDHSLQNSHQNYNGNDPNVNIQPYSQIETTQKNNFDQTSFENDSSENESLEITNNDNIQNSNLVNHYEKIDHGGVQKKQKKNKNKRKPKSRTKKNQKQKKRKEKEEQKVQEQEQEDQEITKRSITPSKIYISFGQSDLNNIKIKKKIESQHLNNKELPQSGNLNKKTNSSDPNQKFATNKKEYQKSTLNTKKEIVFHQNPKMCLGLDHNRKHKNDSYKTANSGSDSQHTTICNSYSNSESESDSNTKFSHIQNSDSDSISKYNSKNESNSESGVDHQNVNNSKNFFKTKGNKNSKNVEEKFGKGKKNNKNKDKDKGKGKGKGKGNGTDKDNDKNGDSGRNGNRKKKRKRKNKNKKKKKRRKKKEKKKGNEQEKQDGKEDENEIFPNKLTKSKRVQKLGGKISEKSNSDPEESDDDIPLIQRLTKKKKFSQMANLFD